MIGMIPVLILAAFPGLDGGVGQAQASPDALLRGIKQLAIVVDKMDDADAKCGLTENDVQQAAAKALTDNSIQLAATRQDFLPFLYIRTTSLHTSDGQCITHVLTTIRAYVSPPKLVWTPEQPALSLEVVLREQGGIVYTSASGPHAQSVQSAVGRYAGRLAAAIAAANK